MTRQKPGWSRKRCSARRHRPKPNIIYKASSYPSCQARDEAGSDSGRRQVRTPLDKKKAESPAGNSALILQHIKLRITEQLSFFLVRGGGLEPPHHCWRQDLNLVRLPISPPARLRLQPAYEPTRLFLGQSKILMQAIAALGKTWQKLPFCPGAMALHHRLFKPPPTVAHRCAPSSPGTRPHTSQAAPARSAPWQLPARP